MHETRKRPTTVPLIQTNHTQEKKSEREVQNVLLLYSSHKNTTGTDNISA